ncbi:MAG: serine/threonine-protein kinase [Planctomycetes bacterium]|nr:serine/threonine-protein kinase [Planctomycetota bacterium]
MTPAGAADDASDDPDDALLDGLMVRFLADLAAGRDIDPDAAVPGRPDLRDRVREVLAIARDVAPKRGAAAQPIVAGHRVVRELGRGGMAHVYLAVDLRLGRTVALKVLPRRLTGPKSKDRFLREARAIARLSHPLIVPIHGIGDGLDGDDGQPWFSMAYVEGRTLSQALSAVRGASGGGSRDGSAFARAAGIAGIAPERWRESWVRAVVQAAIDVADALAHAHAHGVVHRDVKPSNVMLRPDGFALLLDFGLADVEDESPLTLTNGFLGTPQYASPEQAAGGTDSLDAQSDVFSLGATLYEALTLDVPFPGPTPQEILRRVQTWDPRAPSKLAADVPEDLETVVLCALEKDRAKRYASAAAFADDLRAFLDGGPVRARRAGVFERGLRMVKRHRALTELLVEQQTRNEELRSAVLRAERNEADARAAREEADRERRGAIVERDNAKDVVQFLQNLLASADPTQGARDVRVADLLGRAETDAAAKFAARPEVAVDLYVTIARTLVGLGRYADARRVAERALVAARSAFGDDHGRTCDVREIYAECLAETGRIAAAEAEFSALAAIGGRVFGPGDARTLAWRSARGFALTLLNRRDESEPELRDVLARCRAGLGPDHLTTLSCENMLGFAISVRHHDAPETGALYTHCYEGRRRVLGDRHPETFRTAGALAGYLLDAGRIVEAEALQAEVCAIACDLLGPEHKVTLLARHNHARMLRALGRLPEALAIEEATVAAWRCVYASTDVRIGVVLRYLCRMRAESGDIAGAVAVAEEAVASAARIDAGDAIERGLSAAMLAFARVLAGDVAAAEASAIDALALCSDPRVRSEVEGVARRIEERGGRAPLLRARLA